jgi:Cu(I)/Ag(I) efflux system membrane fusion protein
MKTKKIIIISSIFLIGILIGKFSFSNTAEVKDKHTQETVEAHWTCSMHPEIDLPESGACPKCGMALIPKKMDDAGLAKNAFKMSKNAMALANIETLIIGKNTTSTTGNGLKLSGKITANDKESAVQTAHFGGRIEHLYIKSVGEKVSRGALVGKFYSPELVTAQNELIEAIAIKDAQPELYKAVRNKLKYWKVSEKQIQQIERDKKVIQNFNMYADVSGFVSEIITQEGSHVKEGAPLFKVSNLNSVWASFDVYEQDINQLKKGQDITIKLHAYPNELIHSKINYIDPVLNSKTRTITVRTTLKNKNNHYKPGMLLTATVSEAETTISQTVVSIPKTAVMWTGKRALVYIKTSKNEPIFEMREVQLGKDLGTDYEIIEGLKDGDEVVVNGTFTVDATAQLQGKKSMMNQTGAKIVKSEQLKNVNPLFKEQFNTIFSNYIALKDAFVQTDATLATTKAKTLTTSINKVNMNVFNQVKAHEIWMSSAKKLKTSLANLQKETAIEKQREIFITISNEMIVLASSFGSKQTIYIQHCPMADGNKGADWLSTIEDIKNPYFGDKMLQCGSVIEIIEK